MLNIYLLIIFCNYIQIKFSVKGGYLVFLGNIKDRYCKMKGLVKYSGNLPIGYFTKGPRFFNYKENSVYGLNEFFFFFYCVISLNGSEISSKKKTCLFDTVLTKGEYSFVFFSQNVATVNE